MHHSVVITHTYGRTCELSQQSGALVIYDLESSKVEPDLNHVILVTESVKQLLDGAKFDATELRFLENTVWSTVSPVRRAAVHLLERIEAPWARAAIENAQIMDDG